MSRMPDIIVIGAMKCATSSICSYFEKHPDLYFLPGGEPDFFSKDENWAKGLTFYQETFSDAGAEKLIGEGSNSYSMTDTFPNAPERLKSVIPEARLIYSVRHPVERIVSAWAQLRYQSAGDIPYDINDAVREHRDWIVKPSFYWRQLSAYLDHFPKEQIWIGFLEELKADGDAFYASLCAFCDIAPFDINADGDGWKNKKDGRPMLGARYDLLRRLPGVKAAAHFAPSSFKTALKTRLKEKTPSTHEALAQLDLPDADLKGLREDAAAFLAFTGRPADMWRF